ncbi:small conductance mechanosensitive channel [Dysgonomonas macrotermitis]|uniref:Small conductance mechanosensitive channel n=2 Tax=Dysgonomonas macrotermitis TaxID=1346286 RepID=A0A1M5F6W1_9BACT|nr:small conductance mechanosensitive channel [Dysgonomonas macrotermitis]
MINMVLLQAADEVDLSTLNTILHTLLTKLASLGERIIFAVIIYFIGIWVVKLLKKLIARILERKRVEGAVLSFVNNMVDALLKLVLALIIIGILGIETTSFAAILAAAGLAVGMAMKDNLSNFAGGVMILLNKPFRLNDSINAQGVEGVVKEIGILYTVLLTGDNRTIYLPNGPLSTGTIVNITAQPQRRIDITLNINYGNSAEDLKVILDGIIKRNDKILKVPQPFVGVTLINNGNFDITLRVWVQTSDYGDVNVGLNESIYKTLTENGIYAPSSLLVRMAE